MSSTGVITYLQQTIVTDAPGMWRDAAAAQDSVDGEYGCRLVDPGQTKERRGATWSLLCFAHRLRHKSTEH